MRTYLGAWSSTVRWTPVSPVSKIVKRLVLAHAPRDVNRTAFSVAVMQKGLLLLLPCLRSSRAPEAAHVLLGPGQPGSWRQPP